MIEHKPGDFALVDMHGLVSAGIRFGQWLNGDGFSTYEHALIYGDDCFIEATPKHGIMRNPANEYNPKRLLWSSGIIPLTDDQRAAILFAAVDYIGVGYSFLDYFALAAHRFHIWAPLQKRYVASTGHMICSQFVDQCYSDAGIQLFDDKRWPGYVTPGDLYKVLEGIDKGHE